MRPSKYGKDNLTKMSILQALHVLQGQNSQLLGTVGEVPSVFSRLIWEKLSTWWGAVSNRLCGTGPVKGAQPAAPWPLPGGKSSQEGRNTQESKYSYWRLKVCCLNRSLVIARVDLGILSNLHIPVSSAVRHEIIIPITLGSQSCLRYTVCK